MATRQIWIYGLLLGILFLVLRLVHYKVLLHEMPIELFGICTAIVFLGLGIWLGINWQQKKSLSGKFKDEKLGLSQREMEVLELMAKGLSNQQIANKLFVSLNTAKTHVSSIYQKLNAKRRTQAIEKARELEIIGHQNE